MRSGDLRHRITVQQRGAARDSYGQRSSTWSDVATVWADIQPLSGRELEAAQATHSEVSHQVMIRYRAGVTAAMRLVYQGRILNIRAVLDVDTRHVSLQLLCSEGMSDGR